MIGLSPPVSVWMGEKSVITVGEITMAQAWEIIGIMKSKGWNEDKCKSVLTDKYALLIERPKLMDTIKQLTEDQAIEFKIYLSEANNGV